VGNAGRLKITSILLQLNAATHDTTRTFGPYVLVCTGVQKHART